MPGLLRGILPASKVSAERITAAARANGLKTDNATLNRIVAGINAGLSVSAAARKAAKRK